MSEKPKRRWYQFSLLTMFLLVTAFCVVPLSWVANERRKASAERESVEAIEKLSGRVSTENGKSALPRWLQFLMGTKEYGRLEIIDVTGINDEGMAHLSHLKGLKEITFAFPHFTEAGLAELRSLCCLESLTIYDGALRDAGLAKLQSLRRLKSLAICGDEISDQEIAQIAALTQLESLDLMCEIKSASLAKISEMPNLKKLRLSFTGVTDTGLSGLPRLKNLESLYLREKQISDAGFVHVGQLSKLVTLEIRGNFTDKGLQELHGLKHLSELDVSDSQVTWSGLRQFWAAVPGTVVTTSLEPLAAKGNLARQGAIHQRAALHGTGRSKECSSP